MKGPLSKDKDVISAMFDSIAPKYDFLNHLLSFSIDKKWRRKLINIVKGTGAEYVLDLACGTGDVSWGLYKKQLDVIGLDISEKMLEIARKKYQSSLNSKRPRLLEFNYGAADHIVFDDNTFDAITISFGIRNFDLRNQCIQEIFRVLKIGGTLAILEFTIPEKRLLKNIYTLYFKKILPMIGKLFSGNRAAYTYLPISAFEFPQRKEFCAELYEGGFCEVSYIELTGGIACIYIGKKQ